VSGSADTNVVFIPRPQEAPKPRVQEQQLQEEKDRPKYNLTVQHPEWGFRNQSIRVYVEGNAIEDASHLRITVGRNVFEIPKERLKKDENGNYYFEIGLDQSGPALLRVDAYRENRMLSSYSGRINVLDDRTRVNATSSVRVEEGRSGRVDVNAEYRLLYGIGSVNLDQNLGVYGVAEGKDGRFYLILPPGTKVNGEEPKTRVMSFESREELEKYLHENVIQTEFRQNGNNLYYRETVEISSDLARNIDRIQWFVNGTVNVNGINREVSGSADTNVVFIPRPQEAPKPRVQEQQLQEEKDRPKEKLEQERQREELKLTLQVPERIVSGSNQPIPVQMVHNGKEGFVFGVNSNGEIVLPDGRVVGRLEQFRDPITGLIDLDKLYEELSKYPEARNITQMYNPGSDFTVYGLTVGEDGEKKLVEQKVMAVPVEVSISGEGGSIRNGIVEKGATITFEYTKEATGIDPLVQLNINGRSLETLVREGLVEIVENNPGKMVIRLTDRGMQELGKDGKLEVRYKAEDVGIQGAHGSVEIARELDLGVKLFVNRATINAPELYIVHHRNGILARDFNKGSMNIRIETNQMKDYNGDGRIDEEDVREAIRKGHITIELAGAPVRVDFLRDIRLERDGDNYVISFNIADSDILGIALKERINLNRADSDILGIALPERINLNIGATTMRIAINGEIVANLTIGFVNIITHDLPSQIPYNIQVITQKIIEFDITQPGTRDRAIIKGIDGIENISRLIQNFRLGSAPTYPLENVRRLFGDIKIKKPKQEDTQEEQEEPIQVLLDKLGIDGFSLGDLIPLASKSMGQLTQEERVKLAIFALALHLNGKINNLGFYPSVSADEIVGKLEELGILKYAHELLRALVGDMDDNTRKAEFDRLSNSIPDQLNAGQQYYSLLKAFLGKVSETEREVVVIETEIARFNIDRILWEKLSPEERIQLVLSLGVGISIISANVGFGVGVKPKLEFRVEYEGNGRVKIRGYGGVEGRYVIPVLDSEKLLSNMNYLNAYAGVLGNLIIFQNRDGSVEIYFGARADIRNVLGSGESPREIVVVGQAGLVSRLFYTEENGVGYYKIETRVGIDGRIIGTGELRLDRGTAYLNYNFNPLGVGIGVNIGFNNGQFSVQTVFANI
ncbi:MAG: EF-hand domain-containing protein, partial [Candidatus Anstonellales archaeon]